MLREVGTQTHTNTHAHTIDVGKRVEKEKLDKNAKRIERRTNQHSGEELWSSLLCLVSEYWRQGLIFRRSTAARVCTRVIDTTGASAFVRESASRCMRVCVRVCKRGTTEAFEERNCYTLWGCGTVGIGMAVGDK